MRNLAFISAFLFALLFSVGIAVAQSNETTLVDFTKIKNYQLPDLIGKLVGDARVNIYDYESNPLGSFVVLNGTLREGFNELIENPTHNIFAKDKETIQEIFDAPSFFKEFNRQRSLNNIRLEAISFIDQIKLTIGTWIIAITSLFIVPE